MATTITPPTSPNGALQQNQQTHHQPNMKRPQSAVMRPSTGRPRSSSRISNTSSTKLGSGNRNSDEREDVKTAVKVAVRVRPPLRNGEPGFDLIPQRFRSNMVDVPTPTSLTVESNHGKKLFVFDRVFNHNVDQEGVWEYISESVACFLQGYNVSILAYGQSGAGKSYTMGTSNAAEQTDPELMGIIPRAAAALFDKLSPAPASPKTGIRSPNRYSLSAMNAMSQTYKSTNSNVTVDDSNWKMVATYVEIYQEQLRDLLVDESVPFSDRPQVCIREDAKGRILLTGLQQIPISSIDDLMSALNFGSAIRQTDSTAINARSSRSHAVFTINLVQKKGQSTSSKEKRRSVPLEAMSGSEQFITVDSKLHFVDLAGSERLKNTNAHGERAKEGISINAGLASLGKVIAQLSSRQVSAHISYRDSRLTRLLQDSLGGNAITYMVACINPADFHLSETLNTVTYAQRARAIQSKPQIQQINDETDKQAVIDRLRAEIQFLRDQIRLAERSDRGTPQGGRSERLYGRNAELQNQLLDIQENYNALSQRHAKMIGEIAKARDSAQSDESALGTSDAIGSSTALDRLTRSASFQESVESIVLEYEKTIETLEASLSTTRSTLSVSESTLLEKETRIAYLDTLNHQLQSRLQKAMDRESNDDTYLRELEARVAGATTDEERSNTLIAGLKGELARLRETEVGAEDYISTLEERLAEAEQQHESMTREIERLEYVVERQRSINKLDNLLHELDHNDEQDANLGESLRPADPSINEDDKPFHQNSIAIVNPPVQHNKFPASPADSSSGPTSESMPLFETLGGAVRSVHGLHIDPLTPFSEPYRQLYLHDNDDATSSAQSKFVNDKLESVTQELFDLRVEHENTVSENEELTQKYQLALQSLAEMQDALEDAQKGNVSRPMSRIAEGSGEEDREHAVSSLSLELLSAEQQNNNHHGEDLKEFTSAVASVSQREEELLLENEELKQRQADSERTIHVLKDDFSSLKEKHQGALEQVEELKGDLQRSSRGLNGRASPNPGMLRRKERASVISDRANRSFLALRTLVMESFEGDEDKQQNFESNMNLIVTEFHARSERVVQLEGELATLKKEMDAKTALIAGLTRERSSVKPMDMATLLRMESQLRESETEIQKLHDSAASREKELVQQIDELTNLLDSVQKADASASSPKNPPNEEQVEAVSQLQKEVSDWRTKHDSVMESMKVSEKQFLATISDLETTLKTVEQQASRSVSPEDFHQMENERQHHIEKISSLEKEIADHKAATMSTTQRLAELQEKHIDILQQVDRDNQAKVVTIRELEDHKRLVVDLGSQLQIHQDLIQTHQKAIEELTTSHANELETVKFESAQEQKLSEEKLQAAVEQHEVAISSLQREIEQVQAGSTNSQASAEAELAKQKQQTASVLADASLILSKPTNLNNITSHILALVNARKDIGAIHETATSELINVQRELEVLKAQMGSGDALSIIEELKQTNDKLVLDITKITDKEKKSAQLVEELEQQLESNYEQIQATNAARVLEKQLEEAQGRISQLELDLVEAKNVELERSNSARSEHTNNLRKSSSMPSPPPKIPLPPLPPTPTFAHAPGMSPPQSRHTSKDVSGAQVIDDQEARLRVAEKHLFAEKQLTATLEEALTDLESSSTKLKSDGEAWRKKCSNLEDEILLMKREKQNSRHSAQQLEEEYRRRLDLDRAKLEERMQQLTMTKKQKKKSSINCF